MQEMRLNEMEFPNLLSSNQLTVLKKSTLRTDDCLSRFLTMPMIVT